MSGTTTTSRTENPTLSSTPSKTSSPSSPNATSGTLKHKIVALIDTEEGYRSVRKGVESGAIQRFDARTVDEVDAAYWEIKRNQDRYSHVVFDTVTEFSKRAFREVMVRKYGTRGLWEMLDEKSSYTNFGDVAKIVLEVMFNLRQLSIPVIYILHEKDQENPENSNAKQLLPSAIGQQIAPDLMANADAMFRLGLAAGAVTINGVEYDKGTRFLRTKPDGRVWAGYREDYGANIPELIPNPTLSHIVKLFGGLPKKTVLFSAPKIGKTTLACQTLEEQK